MVRKGGGGSRREDIITAVRVETFQAKNLVSVRILFILMAKKERKKISFSVCSDLLKVTILAQQLKIDGRMGLCLLLPQDFVAYINANRK